MSCDLQCPQHIYNKYAPNNSPQCGTDNPYLCYGGIPIGGCNSDPNFWTQNRGCGNCCNMNLGPAPLPTPAPAPTPTGPSLKQCIDHMSCTTDPAKIISNLTGQEGSNNANNYGCTLADVSNNRPPAHLDNFGGGDLPDSRPCEMQDYCQSVANSEWPSYPIGTVFLDYIKTDDGTLKNVCENVSQDWNSDWWDLWKQAKSSLGCNIDNFPEECKTQTYSAMPRCAFTDNNPNSDYEGMEGSVGVCAWDPTVPADPNNPYMPHFNPKTTCTPFIGNCNCPTADDELATQCINKYPQIACNCDPTCDDPTNRPNPIPIQKNGNQQNIYTQEKVNIKLKNQYSPDIVF